MSNAQEKAPGFSIAAKRSLCAAALAPCFLGRRRRDRGGFKDAAADLSRSLERNDSAYPMLFRFLAEARIGENAVARLETGAGRLKTKEWPYPVIELYLGRQGPDATLKAASNDVERC